MGEVQTAETVGQRLRRLRGGESPESFAKRFGVSRGTLDRYELGKRLPRSDFLRNVCEAYDLSETWLLRGEGPMRRGEGAGEASGGGVIESGEFAALPVYEPRASAGPGAEVPGERVVDWLHFKRSWLKNELGAAVDDLYLLYVEGDSMAPTLQPGDVILVKRWRTGPAREGIYVFRAYGAIHVKRVQFLANNAIKALSDNPANAAMVYPLDDDQVEVIGRVVWAGKRM
ncbi:MAG: S24 family peptidase [Thermodesulfobacteriota bacterium]